MKQKKGSLLALILLALFGLPHTLLAATPAAAAPFATLVIKAGKAYKPAGALAWKQTSPKAAVIFTLAPGLDAKATAQTLAEGLANVKIEVIDASHLTIAGMALTTLLDHLSRLKLASTEEASDPLAEITGLGSAVAFRDSPEAGGSIRATNSATPLIQQGLGPTKAAAASATNSTPRGGADPLESIEAEVLAAERANFPATTLTLRVLKPASQGPWQELLQPGKTITAAVAPWPSGQAVDCSQSHAQQNLAGYFLLPGDRIRLNLSKPVTGAVWSITWLERRPTP